MAAGGPVRRRDGGNAAAVKAVEWEENRRGEREHGGGWTRFGDGEYEDVVDREQRRHGEDDTGEDERWWSVVDEIGWN
ncbi:hypothetical protein PIB30_028943 [Stylosanthes scabra]|uniref:Uncharacterized protein n=1 Tax=Stylosanthes scabra TaxID=79078 RepID=A0ABU6SBA8_9FABA|nr:hypothetical protein [Stylosanthes scabra]